jgi:phospholipase C
MGTDRRTFIKTAAAGFSFAGLHRSPIVRTALSNLGQRKPRTPITNLVVVMMENRSVDHYLGWYGKENPNFDARQSITVPDLRPGKSGTVTSKNWGQRGFKSFHGRGYRNPSHNWDGGRAEKAGGAVTGWLHPTTKNDEFALGYYDDIDVPVWAQLVRDYQSYDRWHCSLLGPTEPNRYYLHSGQSGGLKNNDIPPVVVEKTRDKRFATGWDWPTLWSLYDRYDMTAGYYAGSLADLGYWGPRHVNRIRTMETWYAQCAAGTLPQVSVLCPFVTLSDSFGCDDHPHADIRLGQAYLSDVTEAFVNSRHYEQGALVITYDEWGGFHDHVDPPRIPDDRGTPKDPGGKDDFAQIGFRVPSTIVSPWTHNGGTVDHTLYDHASIVRFITENWNLPYLTKRVRSTNSIEHAFRGFRHFNPEHKFAPYEAPLSVTTDSAGYAARKFLSDETTDPTKLPEVGKIPGTPPWPLPPLVPPPPAPSSAPHDRTGADGLAQLRDMGWFEKYKIKTDHRLADSFLHSRPELLRSCNASV